MALRGRKRRGIEETELEITAFMNLMVILVPFLLVTAVFSRVTVIDLFMPSAAEAETLNDVPFQLEVIVRDRGIELREAKTATRQWFVKSAKGYDVDKFADAVYALKSRYPKQIDATILPESSVAYDVLVQVMDRLRIRETAVSGRKIKQELFPNISIGDAPPPGGV